MIIILLNKDATLYFSLVPTVLFKLPDNLGVTAYDSLMHCNLQGKSLPIG